jgi:hypothetical protein
VANDRPPQKREQLAIHFGERLNVSQGEAWPTSYGTGERCDEKRPKPLLRPRTQHVNPAQREGLLPDEGKMRATRTFLTSGKKATH